MEALVLRGRNYSNGPALESLRSNSLETQTTESRGPFRNRASNLYQEARRFFRSVAKTLEPPEKALARAQEMTIPPSVILAQYEFCNGAIIAKRRE